MNANPPSKRDFFSILSHQKDGNGEIFAQPSWKFLLLIGNTKTAVSFQICDLLEWNFLYTVSSVIWEEASAS